MPSVEKRGKRWRAVGFHRGKRLPAGSHDTKAAALAAAVDVERKAKAGQLPGAYGKILRDVFDTYAEKVSPGKGKAKWEANRLAFYARDPIAKRKLAELTAADFADLRDRRLKEVSGGTILRDFALLSNALKVAKDEWGWIEANPLSKVRRPRDNAPRARRLREGEIDALRVASGYRPNVPPRTATARVVAAFEFSCETAMRGGEICALRPQHCHETHVHVADPKNKEPRDVPLSTRARAILKQVLALKLDPVFGLTVAHKDALFRKVRRRAAIEGLNFHDARREGTSQLAKRFDVLELSRVTGHRDLGVLRDVYYRPTIEELAAKVR